MMDMPSVLQVIAAVVCLIPVAMVLIVLCGRMNRFDDEEETVIGDVPRRPE